MKKLGLILLLSITTQLVLAQEGSDIYLMNFKLEKDQFYLSNPRNITNTPGYDNQPFFLPDSENILYSSDDGFGQTDIYRYNIKARSERRLTFTPDSEYSPTLTPDHKFYSCVILERDGDQFLWKYPLNGAVPAKVTSVDAIGYHCWLNETAICAFLVGEPNTLTTIDLSADKATHIQNSPGRTLIMIPDTNLLSYIDIQDEHHWVIKSYNPDTHETADIIKAQKGFQDFTWTPSGILLSGNGRHLYKFDPETDEDWVELADLHDYGLKEFTRLTVSPNGALLALVVSE
jgi:hypothetical protein